MINKRILVVEVNWLGDVLFSTAAIRALKNKFSNSYVGVLVHKRCKDVLLSNPYINEIIVLDEDGQHKGFFGKLRLIKQLNSGQFDTAYLFHRSFTRTLICFFSGIRNRIGYYTKKRGFLLTESIVAPKEALHRAAHYYYLVTGKITFDKETLRSDFFVDNSDLAYVENLLRENHVASNNKIVVMHPAGNWHPKRWPKENFAKLADRLIEEFGAVVIFSGAPKDREVVEGVLNLMKNKAINLATKTSIKQLGALFKRADIVISNDSGPLHIAVALNRPTVAIFGPTSKDITGPLAERDLVFLQKDVGCAIPCYQQNCMDNRCMKEIGVEEIINCIKDKQWLAKQK